MSGDCVLSLLFVDASGSTYGKLEYWEKIQILSKRLFVDDIYTWDSDCRLSNASQLNMSIANGIATEPNHILEMLSTLLMKNSLNKPTFKLHITTDGEVSESCIRKSLGKEYDIVRASTTSVDLYYIGYENQMNLGLNMIFGDATNLRYYINNIDKPLAVSTIIQLTKRFELTFKKSDTTSSSNPDGDNKAFSLDELLDSTLKKTLITRIGYEQNRDNDDAKPLLRLRSAIISAFNRAKENLSEEKKSKLSRAYAEDDAKTYIDTLKLELYDASSLNRQLEQRKSELLSYFDKHNRQCYQRIDRFVDSKSTPIEKNVSTDDATEEDSNFSWSNIDDDITFDKLNDIPCVPVRVNPSVSSFTMGLSTEEIRHPLALLGDDNKRKLFAATFIEPHFMSYQTIENIGFVESNRRECFVSPYTRQLCYPLIVAPRVQAHLRYNTAAVSRLFDRRNDCAMPGTNVTTIVLWNFIVLWCVYERFADSGDNGDKDDENKSRIMWQELQKFCETFHCSRFLSVKCTISSNETVSLREALWVACWAAPQEAPNSAVFNQLLRRSFGHALFESYLMLFLCDDNTASSVGTETIEKVAKIRELVNRWAVWSYMIDTLNSPGDGKADSARRLEFRIRAQWQRWMVHNDDLILLSGACEQPYPCMLNALSSQPKLLWTMFQILNGKQTLSRFHDVSSLDVSKTNTHKIDIYERDENCDLDELIDLVKNHMSINPRTGHAYVMCRKTGLHWRECVGQYDTQRESWYRLFNRYCDKYKRYPSNHLDLVALLSHRYFKLQENQEDRQRDYVIDSRFLPIFQDIFNTFDECVISRMSVKEYLSLYNSFRVTNSEQKRLEFEDVKPPTR